MRTIGIDEMISLQADLREAQFGLRYPFLELEKQALESAKRLKISTLRGYAPSSETSLMTEEESWDDGEEDGWSDDEWGEDEGWGEEEEW